MSFIDLFPTVVFKTKLNLPQQQLNSYENNILSFPLIGDGTRLYTTDTDQLLKNPIFDTLSSHIITYSKEYLDNIGHQYKDLQISSSWGVLIDKEGSGKNHIHSNSYISGVFYLSTGSPLTLHKTAREIWNFNAPIKENSYRSISSFDIFPEPNLLILFPSWLPHQINKSMQDKRTSIAFNIIPKGEFGGHTQKLYL